MKRRFRQKQDKAPKKDPEKTDGQSKDNAGKNVDIEEIIREINKQIETPQEKHSKR